MKPKDVSAPIKVEHVSHVGQEDVHVENGSITATPPTPCGGTESHLATQVRVFHQIFILTLKITVCLKAIPILTFSKLSANNVAVLLAYWST